MLSTFYISLEAELFWLWDPTPWNWYCCRTLPSIADEDIEAIFYALDDSGDFKVRFLTLIFYYCKYLLSKQWNSSSDPWGFVHVGNLMYWLFSKSIEKNLLTLAMPSLWIWKGMWGELHLCLHLDDVPYIKKKLCMFLEMNF